MSYQQDVFALVAQFSGQSNVVSVPRTFCKMTGSLEAGMFLSQLLYWSDRGGRNDGWFYKSYKEWSDEIFLSEYQIRKITKQFEALGFLETTLRKADGAPTIHYRIKQAEFSEWILKFLRNDSVNSQNPTGKIEESITEITTETTTDRVEGVGRANAAQSSETHAPPTRPIDLALPNPPTEAEMAQQAETSVSVRVMKYKATAYAKGPYLKGVKLTEGYIAPGAGINAVQVYHERNSADDLKLTDPQQDDLITAIQDLDQWRRVVIAWNQAGYNPRNLKGHLDWYRNGIPEEKGTHHAVTNGRNGTSYGKPGGGPLPEPVKQDWIFNVNEKREPDANKLF